MAYSSILLAACQSRRECNYYEARWKDGPLANFINAVQLRMAENAGYPADLWLAVSFDNEGQFKQGPIK